ncbi:Arylsulfatase [Sedimentisphaera cyanobacteriorum]|uniref:Arylsulfatase n=1 Tax=Sedimentisphaera cyanobacteriorum TaxID=1940790 RepID=A0A1Q2HQF6_9BACT|nr:sulfatase-like hydrolase/transferase [Sedimentisphaera cyanobacteriorum]AQQ09600.1 Arylsulfatase [Sedimentisphaera cyanobacteriorum]
MLSRRNFIKSAGAGVLAASLGSAELFADQSQKPNILMILIDDLGYSDVSCYGSESYHTPSVDKLAREGLSFSDAYAACPVCSPTRASILTGKHPARLHLTDWIPGHKHPHEKLQIPDWQKVLPQKEITIGEALKKIGYNTAWLGKWHQGGKAHPTEMGFDRGGENWSLNKKKTDKDPKGTVTLTRQCQDFIRDSKKQNKPFFACLSHYTVHTPVYGSSDLKEKYKKYFDRLEPRYQDRADYAAMVADMDKSVGDMLRFLRHENLEDTIVIFFSDNGGLFKKTHNYPLRAGKGTLYEGGIRVPLIFKWPGVTKAGEETKEIATSHDLYTTVLSMAGIKDVDRTLDGVDLSPLLKQGKPIDREAIYWHYPHYHKTKPASAVRKGDYKLIEYLEDGKKELYNLERDISEKNDLAEKMPEKTKELYEDLCRWREEVGAQEMKPNPNYKPNKAKKKNIRL